MLTLFLIVLETVAYGAMASFEKSFPTDSFPTEDGEKDADEESQEIDGVFIYSSVI